jgi:GDP-L-fucose synthase
MTNLHYSLAGKRVWVAGHRGMVGAAIVRRLKNIDCEILTASRAELDLTRQKDVEIWVGKSKPDAIFMAAARVGGILANSSYPVDFLMENMQIETSVFSAAHACGVNSMMFLGSSSSHRSTRANQPMVRHSENRWGYDGPSVSAPIRTRLHFVYAHKLVWARRYL